MLWPWRTRAATARQAAADLDTRDALSATGTRVRVATTRRAAALDTKDALVVAATRARSNLNVHKISTLLTTLVYN